MSEGLALRLLIAPAGFKGTLSAIRAAQLIGVTLARHLPEGVQPDCCPIADGGDDTMAVLALSNGGFHSRQTTVTGPLPHQAVPARFLVHRAKQLALVEAAQAHGLVLADRTDPMRATSYGVGQLIRQVIAHLAAMPTFDTWELVVTLGGSASTDGGAGALQALGYQFLDDAGAVLTQPVGGGDLHRIRKVVPPAAPWPENIHLKIATDVTNPLLGPQGTATVFAPQKGASPEQCRQLEEALTRFSEIMTAETGLTRTNVPGAGAAGGLGYGLLHLPGAEIRSGFHWLAGQLRLKERLDASHLVITGEGRLDSQSLGGKAVGELLKMAGSKPVVIFCGEADPALSLPPNVTVIPLITATLSREQAMADPEGALSAAVERALPGALSAKTLTPPKKAEGQAFRFKK